MPTIQLRCESTSLTEEIWDTLLEVKALTSRASLLDTAEVTEDRGTHRVVRVVACPAGDARLEWQESQSVDVDERRLEFDQLDGPLAEYRGYWQIGSADEHRTVDLRIDYQVGIPLMDDVFEPLVGDLLRDIWASILEGIAAPTNGADVVKTGGV